MKNKILRLGLIGKDLSLSQSEEVHTFILKAFGYGCSYEKFSVDELDFDNAMRALLGDFDGFNITAPYKREVMEYLDGMVGDALAYGAVNTVLTGEKIGYNTDGVGFLLMLQEEGVCVNGKKALVLGGGGSGRSCAAVLKSMGAQVFMYQRNKHHLLEASSQLGVTPVDNPEAGGFDILVNTTGVGSGEEMGISPVTAKAFEGASWAIDLLYAPKETEFMRLAKSQGVRAINGEAMLFYQGYYADCLYLGLPSNEGQAVALYEEYKRGKETV